MSMSNPTAPVPGERTGNGSTAGPILYVPGPGNGFLITVDTLLCITRVVNIRETTGQLLCRLEPAVAGDGMNQVRVRAYLPTGALAAASIQAAAPINDHGTAAIKAAAPAANHTHFIDLAIDAGAANLVETAGVLGVAGGAVGVTGIRNALHVYGAGAVVPHTWATGALVPAVPASECGGINLAAYVFQAEVKGF